MIIQINEIEKDYFNDYVIMHPIGEKEMVEDWQKVYGFAVTIKKTNIYEVMKIMDSWSCDKFGVCCYFEFG